MIVDVNANLGHWPFRKLNYNTPGGMIELMNRNGVTRAWVAMMDCIFYKDVQVGNRDLSEATKGCEERLKPVAVINPNFPGWEEDLAECVDKFSMRAVRLYPNYHNYTLADECFRRFMDKASETNLVVCIAPRASDERMHHWHMMVPAADLRPLGPIAADHRDVRLVICNVRTLDLNAIEGGIGSHENILVEISHVEGVNGVGELSEKIGGKRVLFGSHAPYQYLKSAVLKMQEADLTEEARDDILFKNAQRLEGEA